MGGHSLVKLNALRSHTFDSPGGF
uniref:Uncharacterized protein n=1 Tax=Anguilla anguilla TaxID=7936 RepID=A0A0E9W959_ANGAN